MTWTRSSGTEGDITGEWTVSDSLSGDNMKLTFNANGTYSWIGNYYDGVRGNAQVWTQTWSDGYYAELRYNDSSHTATSVSVTGPGISGSLALIYDSSNGAWRPSNWKVSFGASHSAYALPLTYTFSVTSASGTTTETATAGCFMEYFATAGSAPKSGGSQTFTWTMAPYQNMTYFIELHNPSGGNIWNSYDFGSLNDVSSVSYTGSSLTPGTTYQYNIGVINQGHTSFECTSFTQASFVY
jgi:hypothetical protein